MSHIPLKVVARLSIIFIVLGLLFLIAGLCIGSVVGLIVLAIGLIILIGIIFFLALFSRCPFCEGFLKVGFHNHYCPHCGNYIDYNT